MKALTDKIVESLKSQKKGFIGSLKNKKTMANSEGFREGLAYAIDTIETLERQAEFEEIARVMMKHLGQGGKYHPHFTTIITNTTAKLVEGKLSVGTIMDYVPD